MDDKNEEKTAPVQISTGAGITLGAIWLAMAGLAAFMFLLFFIWPDPLTAEQAKNGGALAGLTFSVAPLVIAIKITKKIVGR